MPRIDSTVSPSHPSPGNSHMSMKHITAALVAVLALSASAIASPTPSVDTKSIRPFRVHVADAQLADLRKRAAATRWPDAETVADRSQGAQLAKVQELVRYWGTG